MVRGGGPMKTIHFDCQWCGHYEPKLKVVGWTDGAGYVIVTCPSCKNESPSILESECD